MTVLDAAFHGSLIADALALPVHWYCDRKALDVDYPDLSRYCDPVSHHPDSILWRSKYDPLNEDADILHDQAHFWGQHGVHYHQNLRAGENTVNFQPAQALHEQVSKTGSYDPSKWAEPYVKLMRTPGWNRDTYLFPYHAERTFHPMGHRRTARRPLDRDVGGF